MTMIVPQDSTPVTGLDSFDFHGDQASVYTDERGHWIFPGQLCKFMGIDGEAQRQNIQRTHWSEGWTCKTQVRLSGDDRIREHFLLHQRRLPMWLGSIGTTRIKDSEVRNRVEEHQTEFADALADYLTTGMAINPRMVSQSPAVDVSDTDSDLDIIDNMVRALRAERRRITVLERQQAETAAKVAAIEGQHDWFTALGYAKLHGYETNRNYLSRVGKAATALMRAEGREPERRQDATFGTINVYPTLMLEQAFLDVPA